MRNSQYIAALYDEADDFDLLHRGNGTYEVLMAYITLAILNTGFISTSMIHDSI